MIVLLSIVLVVLFSYYYHQQFNRSSRILKTIPGPRSWPILGNALEFLFLNHITLWNFIRSFGNKYYPRGKFMIFSTPMIFLRDPKDLQIYLTSQKNLTKGFLYGYFHDWLDDGMFITSGNKWRMQRKVLTPGLNFNALNRIVKIINNCTIRTIDELRSRGGKENVYVLKNVTSNLIPSPSLAGLANIDSDELDKDMIKDFIESIDTMVQVVTSRAIHQYLPRWCYFNKFTSYGRKNLASVEAYNKLTQEVLHKYENQENESNGLVNKGIITESDIDYNNYPLAIVKQSHIFDEEEIKIILNNAFFGVFDSSRVSMTFILLLLAEHKEAQDKARAEVTAVLAESGGNLGMAELKKLNYLELCIKESLRMFPAVPMIFRYTEEDIQLDNQIIPAGAEVAIGLYDLHRDPRYWPEPDKYDPDRFLPDKIKERHTFAYLPFSAGPRNCLGQKYAMASLKSIIGRILYNFYLEPVDYTKDLTFVAEVMLNTTKPLRAKFIRIDRD